MGFFDKLKPEPRVIVVDHSIGMTRVKGNVQAHGHQPSIVDCPKCLAHPGQGCGGLRHGYYHGPRLTAYTRQELRERKADRKEQAATRQADVDRLVASAELRDRTADAIARATSQRPEVIKEWARRCAYSEWDFMQTITDAEVAKYGWTDEHVAFLQRQTDACVILGDPAGGGAPGVITTDEVDVFKQHVNEWVAIRRAEISA